MRLLTVLLLVLLALLQYDLWVGEGSVAAVWRLHSAVRAQEQENAQLRARNHTLEAEVKDLKQGLDAIEERARDDLGMVREGETFYRVIEKHPGE